MQNKIIDLFLSDYSVSEISKKIGYRFKRGIFDN